MDNLKNTNQEASQQAVQAELDGNLDNLVCDCLFDLKNGNGSAEHVIRAFQRDSVREAVEAFKRVTLDAVRALEVSK
jgi:hypothetical protein